MTVFSELLGLSNQIHILEKGQAMTKSFWLNNDLAINPLTKALFEDACRRVRKEIRALKKRYAELEKTL